MSIDPLTVAIITISDSRALGSKEEDRSGQVIREIVAAAGYEVVFSKLIADDLEAIKLALIQVCEAGVHLVLTTGGTGLAPRDNTPEATKAVLEKEAPGISEAMRYHSLQITPRAMLSRGVSGIRGQSLIVNLPGSPKAVREHLTYVLPTLRHGIEVLRQAVKECESAY